MSSEIDSQIRADIEKTIRKQLKIPRRQRTPSKLKAAINKAAKDVGTQLMQQYISKQALVSGKAILREADYKGLINQRLVSALEGVKLVSQSTDLQKILEENAKMLYAKRKALETAGFSNDEAFQLVLAEVSAKKAK
jgi:hypothetical protein